MPVRYIEVSILVPVEVNTGAPILAMIEREVAASILVLITDFMCGRNEAGGCACVLCILR